MRKLHTATNQNTEICKARALYYDFFSRMFLYDLLLVSQERLNFELEMMQNAPLEESLLTTYKSLQDIVQSGLQTLKEDYTTLFVFPRSNTKVHLILSHYVDNNVAGSILLEIRQFFRKLPVRLNSESFEESEEHFGFLMALMGYMLEHESEFAANVSNELFARFIAPFGKTIATELQHNHISKAYEYVGILLEQFLLFEESITA